MKDFLFPPEQARTPVGVLSGGERGRLALARALAQPSNLLVLDEPTNDLDLETLDLLQEMLADYPGTVILVSHDRDFLDRVATSVIVAEGDGRWQSNMPAATPTWWPSAAQGVTAKQAPPRGDQAGGGREGGTARAPARDAQAQAVLQGQARAGDAAGHHGEAPRRDRAPAGRRSPTPTSMPATPPPSTGSRPPPPGRRPSSPQPRRSG